ncbi:MAG: metalloregulator ArsR/SmtB family transcription factor [Haloarculaceae archaeon]
MDSAELLDLLGNGNRRRILRLLSQKPCYVTEISDYLGVSPKAVIDHLRKLEDAGLVESRTDDKRRKYFSIARNVRLEVSVSPYEFGTKSAYPASRNLDMTRWRYLTIEVEEERDPSEDGVSLDGMAETLTDLEQLENELSLAQRWVQGRISEIRSEIADEVEDADPRLATAILRHLADEGTHVEALSDAVEAPPSIVRETLDVLAAHDVVERNGRTWTLPDA